MASVSAGPRWLGLIPVSDELFRKERSGVSLLEPEGTGPFDVLHDREKAEGKGHGCKGIL
jgi:hypothetical protein